MRTIIVGFDSFDPGVFEALNQAGRMPNLSRFLELGGYSPLEVCSPPQTEVSWTSIATGVDPGSHGLFDFVHRDPQTYIPYVSLLPTKQTMVGEQFLPPYTTRTLFHEAADLGYPATALWWPALFPARPELPVATIPGLGTPDIRGQLGVGTFLTTETRELKKTKVIRLESSGKGRFSAALEGPQVKTKDGMRPALLPLTLEVMDETGAALTLGDQKLQLRLGTWSPVIQLKFKAGFAFSVHAVTQVILTELKDRVSLYFVPLQIHPLHALWHYATPPAMVKEAWKVSGGYLTLGWPQDTNALEDGCINDGQFISLCNSIFTSRKRIFFNRLDGFREGVLAGIFDCLDRVQHMFTRGDADVVHDWYVRLDGFVGEIQARIEKLGLEDHRLLILSDHGFKTFEHKVHLNHWLVGNGYMSLVGRTATPDLKDVTWESTRAYALGLNSLYLNVANREGKGIVAPEQIEPLLDELKSRLLGWKTDDGSQIISRVLFKHEAFTGPYARFGPDLVIGYAPGFRASSETGLGKSAATSLEPNRDHWGADHCIDSTKVPGVLFANRDIRSMPGLSFRDIPFLALGKHLDQSYIKPPSQAAGTGQKDLEERLKGLGYLCSRLPSRQQLVQVYAIIVLIIYSWTILWLFWKLPSWRIFLSTWEILGVLAFSLVTALVESLVVLCVPVILAMVLPRSWFADAFVSRVGSLAATALGYMMFLDDRFKHEMLYPELPMGAWWLALPLAAVVLIPYAAGRITWLRTAVESFADRATILLYVMLPLSGFAIIVVVVRWLFAAGGS